MSIFRRLRGFVAARSGARFICTSVGLAVVSLSNDLSAQGPGFEINEALEWAVSAGDFQGPHPAPELVSEHDLIKLKNYIKGRVGPLDVFVFAGQEGAAMLDEMGKEGGLGACGFATVGTPDGQSKDAVVLLFRGTPHRLTYLHELSHFVGQYEPLLRASNYSFEKAAAMSKLLPKSLTEGFAPGLSLPGDIKVLSVQEILTKSRRWKISDRAGAFTQQQMLEQTVYALGHTVNLKSAKSAGNASSCFAQRGARGIMSLFWVPVMMAAGSSAAQAAGVSPDMVDDLANVPLAPQDLLFAAPSFVWQIYSENHCLPGSKTYEMHLLAEAYKHAPEAFAKCTGISAKGYSDPTFVPPPLPPQIMQQLAKPVVPIVSSPSRRALMGCR